jgi:PAS domain S-box-containing protein
MLMWPAIRFGWRGVALAEFVLTMIAVANTKFGNGPFAESRFVPEQRVFLLQSLLSVGSVAFLALTAIIHERQRIEKKLLSAREEWEQCFNAMPDIVCILDLSGRIVRCNRAMRQRFESVHGDIVGLDHTLVFKGSSASVSKLPWASVLAGGAPVETETTLPSLPGHYLVASYPLTNSFGPQWGAVVIVRDITERMKLEDQLRQSQKMDAVGQLAGGVAHDFNNLLTVIIGYVENSLEPAVSVDENVRFNLSQVRVAADRAAGLTRQLLAFSRQTVLEPRIVDLNAILAESEKMLRRMIGEHIELSVVPDPTVWRMKADSGQIGQLLLNLVLNARDAMPQGGKLTISTCNIQLDGSSLKLQPDAKPGKYVLLSVGDTGCGMTPEVRARIFEPFYTTKGPGAGTGLGLAVVHGIIRQSGGYVEVDSEPGIGSTFKIYFPAVQGEMPPSSESARREPRRGSEKVLLVEDEASVREVTELALRHHGYVVLSATCGKEALHIAAEHECDLTLLLTDVVMPGMNGRQLADVLKSKCPSLKVLYMSGYTTDAAVRYGILEGESNLLQKPFTPGVLAAKVREVIDRPAGVTQAKVLTQGR